MRGVVLEADEAVVADVDEGLLDRDEVDDAGAGATTARGIGELDVAHQEAVRVQCGDRIGAHRRKVVGVEQQPDVCLDGGRVGAAH